MCFSVQPLLYNSQRAQSACCERLGGRHREMSATLLVSKRRWQHSKAVTLLWGVGSLVWWDEGLAGLPWTVTAVPVNEGTFLEAPCKAFCFAGPDQRGSPRVHDESGTFYFIFQFSCATHPKTSTNKLGRHRQNVKANVWRGKITFI